MKRLVSIFIFFSVFTTSLFGDNGDWAVYVWGDVDSIAMAFNSVSMILQDQDFQEMLKYILALISLMFAGRHLVDGDYKKSFAEFAWVLGTYAILIGTTTTVHIVDKRVNVGTPSTRYKTVDNVPFLLAFTAHSASVFVEYFSKTMDTATATVPELSYTASGFLEGFNYVKTLGRLTASLQDDDKSRNLYISEYIEGCVIKYSYAIPSNKIAEFKNTLIRQTNVSDTFDPGYLEIENNIYDGSITCKEKFNNVAIDHEGEDSMSFETALGEYSSVMRASAAKALALNGDGVPDGMANLLDFQSKALDWDKFTQDQIMGSIYTKALSKSSTGTTGLDVVNNSSIAAAKVALFENGSAKLAWMADILPKAMHLLSIIIFISYLPMVVVIAAVGMKKGLMMAGNYFFGFIAFYSLHIALAIVQNVVNYYAQQQAVNYLATLAGSPGSLTNLRIFYQYIFDMTGLAGSLSVVALPLITGIIFKGQTAAAAGIATGVAGQIQSMGAKKTVGAMHEKFKNDQMQQKQFDNMTEDEKFMQFIGLSRMSRTGNDIEQTAALMSEIKQINASASAANAINKGEYGSIDANEGYNARVQTDNDVNRGKQLVHLAGGRAEMINASSKLATDAGALSAMDDYSKLTAAATSMREIAGKDRNYASPETEDEKAYIRSSKLDAIKVTKNKLTKGKLGSEEAYRATGAIEALKEIASTEGNLASQITDNKGDVDFSKPEASAFMKGVERMTRKSLNDAIGIGKAKLVDKNGKPITDNQYFANAQKVAAGKFIEDGINSSVYGAKNTSNKHDKNGFLSEIGLTKKHASAVSTLADVGFDKMHGQAEGVNDAKKKHISYENNARYSELSSASSTDAKIDKAGGIYAAAQLDADSARLQTATQLAKIKVAKSKFGNGFNNSAIFQSMQDAEKQAEAQKELNAIDQQITSVSAALNANQSNGNEVGVKAYNRALNTLMAKRKTIQARYDSAAPKSMTYEQMVASQEKSRLDSSLGQAFGINQNLSKNPDMYIQNAQYSEMQKQQSLSASIEQKGGIDKALNADLVDARVKAQTQVDTLQSRASAAGVSGDVIKKAFEEGGTQAASKIAQSLAKLDAQNAAAKTFSDAELSKNAISLATKASGGKHFETTQDALNYLAAAKGRAEIGRGLALDDGEGVHDLVVGTNGNIKEMKYDTQRKQSYGNSVNTAAMGYGIDGIAGFSGRDFIEGAAPIAGAVLTGYGAKKFLQGKLQSGTKSLWEKVSTRFKGLTSGKANPESLNSAPNSSSHSYDHNAGNGFPNDSHNNSFSNRNIAGQPTSTHPSSIAKKGSFGKKLAAGLGITALGTSLFGDEDPQTQEAVANTEFSNTSNTLAGATLISSVASTKAGAKAIGEAASHTLAKKVPGLSLAAAMSFAYDRFSHGDITGGLMELASGAMATVPGVGTAASFAIDAALLARDMNASANVPQHVQNAFSTPSGYNTQQAMMADGLISSSSTQQINMQQTAQTPVGGTISVPGFSQELPIMSQNASNQMNQQYQQQATMESNQAIESSSKQAKKEIVKGNTSNYINQQKMLEAMEEQNNILKGKDDAGPGSGNEDV